MHKNAFICRPLIEVVAQLGGFEVLSTKRLFSGRARSKESALSEMA
nr:hypothetical protein [Vaginimicrobium propionicum]